VTKAKPRLKLGCLKMWRRRYARCHVELMSFIASLLKVISRTLGANSFTHKVRISVDKTLLMNRVECETHVGNRLTSERCEVLLGITFKPSRDGQKCCGTNPVEYEANLDLSPKVCRSNGLK